MNVPISTDVLVRVVIVQEGEGRWGASSPELPSFVFIADTRAQLEAELPAAVEAHCGRPIAYRFLVPTVLS
jgi:predicted RNase H-like HicB family nuclease